jgi:hypothetical protein
MNKLIEWWKLVKRLLVLSLPFAHLPICASVCVYLTVATATLHLGAKLAIVGSPAKPDPNDV